MTQQVADVPEHWPVESSEDLYRSGLPFALRADLVRRPEAPDEAPFARIVLEHPGAVVVLAVDDDERVLCLRQYRHPARRRMLELPAGLLDQEGEEPRAAAERELLE
ncbi:MAG TPA: NUDIX hydrolase, partial [Nocardioides sp.]|nr:NUDIX hydrolase [Nocardioides sp.]